MILPYYPQAVVWTPANGMMGWEQNYLWLKLPLGRLSSDHPKVRMYLIFKEIVYCNSILIVQLLIFAPPLKNVYNVN